MKSEIQISKFETISNNQNSNDSNGIKIRMGSEIAFVLIIKIFGFRVCFEFRASNFGFFQYFLRNDFQGSTLQLHIGPSQHNPHGFAWPSTPFPHRFLCRF